MSTQEERFPKHRAIVESVDEAGVPSLDFLYSSLSLLSLLLLDNLPMVVFVS